MIHASPRVIGHDRQRRLVADAHRPRWNQQAAQQERAAGAWSVEQCGDPIHRRTVDDHE